MQEYSSIPQIRCIYYFVIFEVVTGHLAKGYYEVNLEIEEVPRRISLYLLPFYQKIKNMSARTIELEHINFEVARSSAIALAITDIYAFDPTATTLSQQCDKSDFLELKSNS